MSEKILSGDRYSFYKLFAEKKFKIEIPIIQRDYAQGRDARGDVRNSFLDALYKYLEDGIPNRDLDFVYGSIDGDKFIPLDGQQRLTTLFLLHWYLCQISENSDLKNSFYETMTVKDCSEKELIKSRFCYETRKSSSEFCDSMMTHRLVSQEISSDRSVSEVIMDKNWFFRLWLLDPTVKSMLTMLDSIHQKFYGQGVFFERLLDVENPVVTFLFMDLKKFKLSDDLYIKMNARGKPLSFFENFKAKFEQYIETIQSEIDPERTFKIAKKTVSLKEYFSHNIDTKWADLFWTYRKLVNSSNAEEDNDFDDEFDNFFRFIFTCSYAGSIKDENLEELNRGNGKISFDEYRKMNALSTKAVLYLVDALDVLSENGKDIKLHLSEDSPYFDEKERFKEILSGTASNNVKLEMHAYLRYLIENKDRSGLFDWMRVVCNLAHPDNTIIDASSELSRSIRSIDVLLRKAPEILKHLSESNNVDGFSSWQIEEEKVKAKLMLASDEWQTAILQAEKKNYPYFNGQIGIILEFAGLHSYFQEHAGSTWSSDDVASFRENFDAYSLKMSKIFDRDYSQNGCKMDDSSFAFERAVLCKGDYLSYNDREKRNLMNTSNVKQNIKRDHSWKRFLRWGGSQNDLNRHGLVKAVLDDSDFDLENLVKSLEMIATKVSESNSWRYCLVHLQDFWKYGYGWLFFEPFSLYSSKGSKRNHTHREVYSYFLWKKSLEMANFNHISEKNYIESTSADDVPCIKLKMDFDGEQIVFTITGARNRSMSDKSCDVIDVEFCKEDGSAVSESVKNRLSDAGFYFYSNKGKRVFPCDNIKVACQSVVDCLKTIDR